MNGSNGLIVMSPVELARCLDHVTFCHLLRMVAKNVLIFIRNELAMDNDAKCKMMIKCFEVNTVLLHCFLLNYYYYFKETAIILQSRYSATRNIDEEQDIRRNLRLNYPKDPLKEKVNK